MSLLIEPYSEEELRVIAFHAPHFPPWVTVERLWASVAEADAERVEEMQEEIEGQGERIESLEADAEILMHYVEDGIPRDKAEVETDTAVRILDAIDQNYTRREIIGAA